MNEDQTKTCNCCKTTHDADAWRLLPYIGVMADEEVAIEMRNCQCGSTLAIEINL